MPHAADITTGRTLIIGFGSELRGDDMLGSRVAVRLDELLDDPAIRVIGRTSLTPDLAADLAEADRVILVDCAAEGPVGVVVRREIQPREDESMSLVHFLDPPALLSWTRRLYDRVPHTVLYTVAGESFEISDDLTPTIAAVLPKLVDRVLAEAAAPLVHSGGSEVSGA